MARIWVVRKPVRLSQEASKFRSGDTRLCSLPLYASAMFTVCLLTATKPATDLELMGSRISLTVSSARNLE